MTDPYKTLHVRRNATPDAILAAYRREAKRWHPDAVRHGSSIPEQEAAAARFKEAQAAFEVLRDPARRAKFDETGEIDERLQQDEGHEARTFLAQVLIQTIRSMVEAGADPEALDIIVEMRQLLKATVKEIDDAIANHQKLAKKLDGVAARFSNKKGGDNTLGRMVSGPAGEVRKLIVIDEARKLVAAAALKIVDDFEYAYERPRDFGGNYSGATSDLEAFIRQIQGRFAK